MSLLEIILDRSRGGAVSVSLQDILTETALSDLAQGAQSDRRRMISQTFFHEILSPGPERALKFVDTLMTHGARRQRILHQYVPDVAALLGEAWEEDTLTFAEVTMLSSRVMGIARDLYHAGPLPIGVAKARRALLIRPPGEDHAMGLFLVADRLRSAGWTVQLELSGRQEAVFAAITNARPDAIGLTIGSARQRGPAKALMAEIARRAPGVVCFAGGVGAPDGLIAPDPSGRFDTNVTLALETALSPART